MEGRAAIVTKFQSQGTAEMIESQEAMMTARVELE